MKRFFCLILALSMLAGLLPALAIGISAEDTGVTVTSGDGRYSISLEKTTFKKGEPVLVTAVGQSRVDWIGACTKGSNSYNMGYYYLGKSGSGTPYDAFYGKTVEAGEYEIYIVPNNGSGYGNAVAKVTITVTDEVYSGDTVYPTEDFGDLSKLVTEDNKRVFKKGEAIKVAASGADKDWLAIYDNVYSTGYVGGWRYISDMGGSGNYADISGLRNLDVGTYLVRLIDGTSGKPYENATIAGIYITIVDEEVEEPDGGEEEKPERTLSVSKTEFAVGEPINITATGYGSDWVGIAEVGGDVAIMWYYVDPYLGWFGPGSGVEFDIKQMATKGNYYLGQKYIGTEMLDIPAGDYEIVFVADNGNLTNGCLTKIGITVVDENGGDVGGDDNQGGNVGGDDNEGGDDIGGGEIVGGDKAVTVSNGSHSITVNKTRFEEGGEIWITATAQDSKDWIGIAHRGNTDAAIRWYYVTTAGNGVAYNIKNAPNVGGNLSSVAHLPSGLYTIYFVERDQFLKNDHTFSINIAIGNVDDPENGATTGDSSGEEYVGVNPPVDAQYQITGNTGYASGSVIVTLDQADNRTVVLYWADENGALNGYTPIRFKAKGITASFIFTESVTVPKGATRLLVYAENTFTKEMSQECISIALPENSQMNVTQKPITSFLVVSDIHIGRDNVSSQNFKNLIKEATVMNPDGIAIYIVGDMADHGAVSEYELMMSLYNEALGEAGKSSASYPLYLALGNHDYPAANVTFLQYATLPNGTHPTDTSYDFWLDGYHYIFLGSDYPSGLGATFTAETLEWFDQKLSENRDPSRPTFVFLHQSIYNTVAGSLPGEGWHGVNNVDEFKAVISKYPEVMLFNGHSHWEMDSDSNVFEGTEELPIHAFNCGSVAYLWTGFNSVAGEHLDGSQGYYVQIYDGMVSVQGRDFANGLWISAAQYMIEMPLSDDDAGDQCEHELATESICYPDGYMKSGTVTAVCGKCGMTEYETAEPMIAFAGYSVATFNTSSICAGYSINSDAMDEYERVNGVTITLGMVAAGYDNVPGAKPINSDGTATKLESGRVVSYQLKARARLVDIILHAKDWTAYGDKKTILCMYMIENGVVSYICDTDEITDTADYVTYNSLIG